MRQIRFSGSMSSFSFLEAGAGTFSWDTMHPCRAREEKVVSTFWEICILLLNIFIPADRKGGFGLFFFYFWFDNRTPASMRAILGAMKATSHESILA